MMLLPVKKKEAERLLRIIEKSIPGQEIEICHSVASLSERLHKPTLDVILIILFITSGLELTKILGMKDALEGLKIIVILPDHDPEMITRSHTLRPRYLTWSDEDLTDVGLIVKQLTHRDARTNAALNDYL